MTASYHIISRSGADFGVYEGSTPAEALLHMFERAGYSTHIAERKVWLEDGELRYADQETRLLLGDISDWIIGIVEDDE